MLRRPGRFHLAHRAPVERVVGGQAHAPIGPRRLRIPHVEEVQRGDPDAAGKREPQRRIPLEFQRLRRVEHVGHVDLAPLQHGRPRGGLGDDLEHESLDRRDLAPVRLVGLHDQLDPDRVAHEPIGAQADRLLLEAFVADSLDVLLRHDPAGARGQGAIERHEIRERLVQLEAHADGIDHRDLAHFLLEDLGALRALEAELHVLGGEGIAVVELETLAELELVDALVRAHRPRLGEARRHEVAGHRLHERVVHRV